MRYRIDTKFLSLALALFQSGCILSINNSSSTSGTTTTTTTTTTTVTPVVISNDSISMNPNSLVTLSVSGGTAPYTYSVTSGNATVTSAGVVTSPGYDGQVSVVRATSADASSYDEATITVEGTHIVIAGGIDTASNSATDIVQSSNDGVTWTDASRGLATPIYNVSSVVFKDKLYFYGGYEPAGAQPVDTIYTTLDVDTVDQEVSVLPIELAAAPVVVYENEVWLIGGKASSDVASDKVWTSSDGLNFANGVDLPLPLFNHSAVVFNGSIYVFGGADDSNTFYSDVYKFDGSSWNAVGNIPASLNQMGATVHDGYVWIIAGADRDQCNNGIAQMYYSNDPDLNAWTQTASDFDQATIGGLAVSMGGNLFFIGGSDDRCSNAFRSVYTTDGVTNNNLANANAMLGGIHTSGVAFTPQ